jgi:uncharacterized protein involved in outer membrane biogenesis
MNSASMKNASADSGATAVPHRPTHGQIYTALAILLLTAIVVPPFIRVDRFRRTILGSISAGLGRPVHATSVELRLLPLPTFVLHDFTVSEDAAFGAEPVLTAESVTVLPRASTLWHRRVEIATLSLKNASVNLVRNPSGHWNFETLLRNSPAIQKQNLRAAAAHADSPMPFPYIEATRTRINLKVGQEKLPFSFEEANLALWQESSHEWRARLRARPVRTDTVIADAGQIRLRASLVANGPLLDSPLQINFEWRKAPLEELGRLAHGRENGWRGLLTVEGKAAGSFSDLEFHTLGVLRGFQRAEFVPPAEVDLSADCKGRYSRDGRVADAITCNIPADDGHLIVAAQSRSLSSATPSVQLRLQHVPASWVLTAFRQIHPGVAPLAITGALGGSANCLWQDMQLPRDCVGSLQGDAITIRANGMRQPIQFRSVALTAAPGALNGWKLSPLKLPLGGASPVTLTGALSHSGGAFLLDGPVDLRQIAAIAQAFRIPALSAFTGRVEGTAQVHLQVASRWVPAPDGAGSSSDLAATPPPLTQWSGQATLENAVFHLPALPRAVHLTAAHLLVGSGALLWNNVAGDYNRIPFTGTVEWQRICPVETSCRRYFDLHLTHVDAAHLAAAFSPPSTGDSLLQFIGSDSADRSPLPAASGQIAMAALTLGPLQLRNARASFTLKPQGVVVTGLSAEAAGGLLTGGSAAQPPLFINWAGGSPHYRMNVDWRAARVRSIAAFWQEAWGSGIADIHLALDTQGRTAADLAANAHGQFQWTWQDGAVALNDAGTANPLAGFQVWRATGAIANRELTLTHSRVVAARSRGAAAAGGSSITGSVSFTRRADLRVGSAWTITGPLSALRAAPQPAR